jgi:hypothetical protein
LSSTSEGLDMRPNFHISSILCNMLSALLPMTRCRMKEPERKFRTLTLMLGKLSSLSDCQHYQLASISKSHHLHNWRGRRWGKAIGPLNLHHPLQIRQSSHPASHRSSFSEENEPPYV